MAAPPIIERHKPHFHRKGPFLESVRVATTANVTISTALNNGDTVDGVTVATGDRVLVSLQSTDSQNGIYVVGASPVRDYDLSTDDPNFGFLIYVREGTINGGKVFANTNTSAPTIGSTSITFEEFTSSGSSSGGQGGFDVTPPQSTPLPPWVKPTGSGVITADPQGRINLDTGGSYKSFPGMAYLGGRLHLVYRDGSQHGSFDGVVKYRTSDDLGRTWTSASTIVSPTAGDDLRDPNLLAMSSGRLLLTYDYKTSGSAISTRVRYSDNCGQTWSSAYTPPNGLGAANEYDVTSPAIELPNGTVLLPGYGDFSGLYRSWVWSSTDGGLTFTGPVEIARDATASLNETTIRYLASGKLVALIRDETSGNTYRSVSTDLGATWSAEASVITTIRGRPDFVEIWPGVLLWFGRGTSNRSRWAVSWDEGATWTALQETDSGGTLESEYHAPVVLAPGYVAVVYSLENSTTDADLFIRYYYDGFGTDPLGNVRAKIGGALVSTTAPTTGQVLTATSTSTAGWATPTTVAALDDLTDVTITSPSNKQMLMYNGTVWVNTSAIWRPLMDGAGAVVTDGATGEAIMALS